MIPFNIIIGALGSGACRQHYCFFTIPEVRFLGLAAKTRGLPGACQGLAGACQGLAGIFRNISGGLLGLSGLLLPWSFGAHKNEARFRSCLSQTGSKLTSYLLGSSMGYCGASQGLAGGFLGLAAQ